MINDYIGIPFIDKGRDFKGCDCYGLIKLYYKNELGIDIPDVVASPNQLRLAYIEYIKNISSLWTTSTEPKENDVVAMKTDVNNPKLVTHFGIIVKVNSGLKILHTFKKSNSHIVDLNNPAYANKIKGFHSWLN